MTPYPLLTPPFSDKTLFPSGFPAGTHPVLVSSGYQNDIRMVNLQISALKSASIYIPYTDQMQDGKTPFNYVSSDLQGEDFDKEDFIPLNILQEVCIKLISTTTSRSSIM